MFVSMSSFAKVVLLTSIFSLAACNNSSQDSVSEPVEQPDQATQAPVEEATENDAIDTQPAVEPLSEERINEARSKVNQQAVNSFQPSMLAQEDAILLDLRSPVSWRAGHIPGATNVSHAELLNAITTIAPDKKQAIYLYCGNGNRSAVSADELQALGYSNVISLDGGFRTWIVSGNTIEIG